MSDRKPAFYWAGLPVYRCQFSPCTYERVGDANLEAVRRHEVETHTPPPAEVRESPILGTDGQPLKVTTEEQPRRAARRRRK